MLTRNILLIPGPITTSKKVSTILLNDYSAREDYFINIIKSVRKKLLKISNTNNDDYTSILMQGSGTYGNEAVISSLPDKSKKYPYKLIGLFVLLTMSTHSPLGLVLSSPIAS